MVSHSSDDRQAAPPIPASRRTEILQKLVEIASTEINAQLDGLTTALAEALLRSSRNTDPAEAKLRFNAATLLKKSRYPFLYVVSARVRAALQHEIKAIEQATGCPADTSGALKSLDPEVEADKDQRLATAGRAIEKAHAARHAALTMRLARLLGREALPAADNPFRPQVFLSAIHDAWCEFHPDTAAHHLVFPLLRPELCIDMEPVLYALNTLLAKHGIQPDRIQPAGVAIGKPAERAPAGAFPALFQDEATPDVDRRALLAYLATLQNDAANRVPAGGAASDAHGLTVLVDLKRKAPPDALTPACRAAIDLLAKVFETIFRDPHLPADIKLLIGSLQVPLLKAALLDRDFFFETDHPARRVLELMTKLGVGWDSRHDPADPLYQTILRNIKRIQSDQRAPAFAAALADLESFVQQEEQASTQALSASISDALRQEKLLQASQAARNDVALRIGTGEVVAFVEAFLEQKWVTVLTLAYREQEAKPDAVASAVKTMDDLIWSVQPKITQEERKQLLAMLPPMIAALNRWLDAIQWNDAERAKFFDELARCHASIVRAPLEISPQRRLEIAIEATRQAAERRRQKLAVAPAEPVADSFSDTVRQLERGAWVEFTDAAGAVSKLKLAWISPLRNLYIFGTKNRQEGQALSADDLARALRENRARVVSISGLVGRAVADALTDSANGAACDGQSAA